ncbi:MAG: alanyl-tRNA editing protein [Phascolarctobacterium sp.]|nr:alanyl-tRNA editing protein [Phascolarctobacterium sp.]
MTIKLFNDNVMLKNCQATVLACEERDGKFFVELDQTVIFPEGGGQLSDRGKINGVNVLHASEKEGRRWYECDAPLEVGAKVEVTLDWAVRLDRMQQHCGEHILSFVCWKLFDSNNIGFHMNEDTVTVDLDKALSEEELLQVEQESNAIIWENRPITVLNLESEEAAKLPMRKFNANLQGILRIVAVENADVCTCCGTHPPVTGMVGCLKIIRAERRKQGQRLEILCGARAMADYAKQNRILRDLATDLSSKVDEVPERYAKMKEEMANLSDALKEKTAKLLDIEIQEVLAKAETRADGAKLLPLVLDDAKTGKNILPRVGALGNTVSVILAVQPERISYFVALGKDTAGDCRAYIKLLNDTFGGRGGGKPDGAQGGADYCEDWQEKFATVLKQLKEA